VSGLYDEPDNATPLTPEERDGLIPTHVTLRHELNALEQQNILAGNSWAFQRRRDPIGRALFTCPSLAADLHCDTRRTQPIPVQDQTFLTIDSSQAAGKRRRWFGGAALQEIPHL